jgi:hypothetical protein
MFAQHRTRVHAMPGFDVTVVSRSIDLNLRLLASTHRCGGVEASRCLAQNNTRPLGKFGWTTQTDQ